ncbi:DUF303 domain-containing protein [Cephalotus follicularis]|uniref:DUF303 domain-containing protein n=1 Tax=Cephalotus follicularis TaxID=3775 RepID=A0A1Q3B2P5_CEPFO|nr:DUF303 domain-containing protein [Cephalotus follicularis]
METEATNPSPTQIFILSGQSNMAGRGGVTKHHHWDGVVPPECQPNPSSILRLTANLHWEPASEPLHADIDTKKVCGLGPGMSFSNTLLKGRVGVVVGLVPCAVGGTAIKEWARGEPLYESMVKRARESVRCGGEIKGLLWYQGESDTSARHDAEAYKTNMEKLIDNVRGDLGLPSLPIVQVAIASGDKKFMEEVREAQFGIDVPNVVCVDARGLPLKEDHLHLTTEAQVKLGHMLADAYINNFCTDSMSSSSVNELDYGGLRYQPKFCKCGKKVAVRIVYSEQNKNKLYYCCEDKNCGGGFLGWCLPMGGGSVAYKRGDCSCINTKSFEDLMRAEFNTLKDETMRIYGRLQLVEKNLCNLKALVIMSMVCNMLVIIVLLVMKN